MKPVKAIVLAGGELDECFREAGIETPNKAFIKINNRPMVEYVIKALEAAQLVESIIVTLPENLTLEADKSITFIKSGDSIVGTVLNGLKFLPENTGKVLLVMSDLPMLTPEAIDDFLLKCSKIDADYYYSILSKEVSEGEFPDFPHTYAKLKDGIFCGGGLTLLYPGLGTPCRIKIMEKLIQARKNPVEMVKILGLKILLKFITRQASIQELEKRVSEIFTCKARAIITPYAEIGINVDKPKELELVCSYILSTNNKVGR